MLNGRKVLSEKEVVIILQNQLKWGSSFSLVRGGDGEGIFFSRDKEKIDFVCNRQLGYTISQDEIDKVTGELMLSYLHSNIIGCINNQKDQYWQYIYTHLNNEIMKTIPFCSIDIHMYLLQSGFLDNILKDRQRLFYISGRNLDKEFVSKFKIKEVFSYKINPEYKFEEHKKFKEKRYPKQHLNVIKWIKSLDCQNQLCLVGAGLFGKVYTYYLKEQGGIVIDLGSIFDMWSGKVTRGKNRGSKSYSNKFKL